MEPSKLSLVRKAVAVLRAVAADGDDHGLSEIARTTGIPKATCLRVLNDLVAEQLVVLDHDSKRYGIAFGALALIGGRVGADSAQGHIVQELQRLSERTGETSGLDVLVGEDVVVIAQVQGPYTINYSPKSVPRTLQSWNTSTGKVLLAGLDEVTIRTAHADALSAARRERGDDSLLDELALVRERGFGTARDEMEAGAAAVAAPVVVDGEVVAAAWIGGPTFRIPTERVPEIAQIVHSSASVLAHILSVTGRRLDGRHQL